MNTAYLKNTDAFQNSETAVKDNLNLVKYILSVIYIVIPVVAGLDKFFNILTDWSKYVNPIFSQITGLSAGFLISTVGPVEIAAGILVLLNRKIGAYIVSLWLVLIALQLITGWMYVDVAVRDLVMAAGAFSLALLSESK